MLALTLIHIYPMATLATLNKFWLCHIERTLKNNQELEPTTK